MATKGSGKIRGGPKGKPKTFAAAKSKGGFRGTSENRVKAAMRRAGYINSKNRLTAKGLAFARGQSPAGYKGAGALKKAMIRMGRKMAGYAHATPKRQKARPKL